MQASIEKAYSFLTPQARILLLLCTGTKFFKEVTAETGLSSSAASRHLAILVERGLVERARPGFKLTEKGRREAIAMINVLRRLLELAEYGCRR